MTGVLYIASSVNGYITVGDTDSSWVSSEDGALFEERAKEIGAMLVGGSTYEQFKGELYPMTSVFTVVLTHKQIEETDMVRRAGTLDEAMELFSKHGAHTFLIAGGASVVGSCLQEGCIGTIYLSVHPLVIGRGLPIFKGYEGVQKLTFVEVVKSSDQHVVLKYAV